MKPVCLSPVYLSPVCLSLTCLSHLSVCLSPVPYWSVPARAPTSGRGSEATVMSLLLSLTSLSLSPIGLSSVCLSVTCLSVSHLSVSPVFLSHLSVSHLSFSLSYSSSSNSLIAIDNKIEQAMVSLISTIVLL